MDINQLLSAVSASDAQAQQTVESIITRLSNMSATAQQTADKQLTLGNIQAEVKTAELQGQLEVQKQKQQASIAMGTEIGTSTDLLTSMFQEVQASVRPLLEQQRKVAEMRANSNLFSNPLGFLNYALYGKDEEAKLEAIKGEVETRIELANKMNQAVQSTAQTQAATAETLTQANIKQAADALKIQSEINAAKASLEASKYDIDALQAYQNLTTQQMNRYIQMYQLQQQQENIEESRAMRKMQMEAVAAERAARSAAKLEEQEFLAETAARINKARAAEGLPPVTMTMIKSHYGKGTAFGQQLVEQDVMGLGLETKGYYSVGTSIGDSALRVSQGKVTVQPSEQKVADFLEEAVNAVNEEIAQVNNPGFKSQFGITKSTATNRDAYFRAVDVAVKKLSEAAAFGAPMTSVNPYKVESLATLATHPDVARTKLGQSIVIPLASVTDKQLDETQIVATAMSQVRNGKLTFDEARDGLVTLFNTARNENFATSNFRKYNLPVPDGYFTRLDVNKLVKADPGMVPNPNAPEYLYGFSVAGQAARQAQINKLKNLFKKPVNLANPQDVTLLLTTGLTTDVINSARQTGNNRE